MKGAIFVLAVFVLEQCCGMPFTKCSTDPAHTALTVHQFNISPNPIFFPGDIHLTVNLTVNRPINALFIDVELYKHTLPSGRTLIPCLSGTSLGSCKNIDICSILPDILSGTSSVSSDLGKQIDAILLASLGHHASCPIQPEKVVIQNELLYLQPIPSALNVLADGDFDIMIAIKEDPTSTENVGCLEFTTSIKRAPNEGFIFGGNPSG